MPPCQLLNLLRNADPAWSFVADTEWQFNCDRREVNAPQELGTSQKMSNINCFMDHIQFAFLIVFVDQIIIMFWIEFWPFLKYTRRNGCEAKSIRNAE